MTSLRCLGRCHRQRCLSPRGASATPKTVCSKDMCAASRQGFACAEWVPVLSTLTLMPCVHPGVHSSLELGIAEWCVQLLGVRVHSLAVPHGLNELAAYPKPLCGNLGGLALGALGGGCCSTSATILHLPPPLVHHPPPPVQGTAYSKLYSCQCKVQLASCGCRLGTRQVYSLSRVHLD